MGGGIGSILYRDTLYPDGTPKAAKFFRYNAVARVVADTDAVGTIT
ncbi:MAG: hypothetical protein AAF911_00925 [Planctomycetota bacterium]